MRGMRQWRRGMWHGVLRGARDGCESIVRGLRMRGEVGSARAKGRRWVRMRERHDPGGCEAGACLGPTMPLARYCGA